MPTGFTAPINDDRPGFDFPSYLWRCVHAFYRGRNDSLDSFAWPSAEDFDSRHLESMVLEARGELTRLKAMTPKERARYNSEHYVSALEKWHQREVARTQLADRYLHMKSQVEVWDPPTDAHQGLKKFMLEQLELCRFEYAPVDPPVQRDYHQAAMEEAEHRIVFYEEDVKKVKARKQEFLKWCEELATSVPPPVKP